MEKTLVILFVVGLVWARIRPWCSTGYTQFSDYCFAIGLTCLLGILYLLT